MVVVGVQGAINLTPTGEQRAPLLRLAALWWHDWSSSGVQGAINLTPTGRAAQIHIPTANGAAASTLARQAVGKEASLLLLAALW